MTPTFLDFRRRYPPPGLSGWLLLVFGFTLLVGLAIWHVLELAPGLASAEAKLRAQKSAAAERRPAAGTDERRLAADWQVAARAAARLAIPWDRLFGALESAAGRPVALLTVEPDAASAEVIITGEARDFDAVLDYYRHLQRQSLLSGVVLQTHQVNRQDRDRPVRFRINARWAAVGGQTA